MYKKIIVVFVVVLLLVVSVPFTASADGVILGEYHGWQRECPILSWQFYNNGWYTYSPSMFCRETPFTYQEVSLPFNSSSWLGEYTNIHAFSESFTVREGQQYGLHYSFLFGGNSAQTMTQEIAIELVDSYGVHGSAGVVHAVYKGKNVSDTEKPIYTGELTFTSDISATITGICIKFWGGDPNERSWQYPVVGVDNVAVYTVGFDYSAWTQREKTNDLLEDIAQQDEREKQAAQSGGNSQVSSLSDGIPSSDGFIAPLRSLVNAMSYKGTDCAWTMPEIKLPAISGVMSGKTLLQSQSINFKPYVDMIPVDIMTIVQSLSTIAIVLFCVKELYGMISYVLTLKKGGSDSE